jgi:hypothetical protein
VHATRSADNLGTRANLLAEEPQSGALARGYGGGSPEISLQLRWNRPVCPSRLIVDLQRFEIIGDADISKILVIKSRKCKITVDAERGFQA